ncbi:MULTISPECIES: sensor histidine kinase [Pseudonocardia]|uniref:histidine kinase n=2 Tax=Pseudonocardia TaxID=1847 RepID=A0A1Y2MYU8_PSEAH|nr:MULTISPECIES: histidine kinase [Pseudonocardia]OSY40350.1 Sensor histidine kinase DesK [Pseudonocardia autotrophica]TDN72321.1 histidine kinase [Pseudonocardia autotrophica]BBG03032.1 two-component sensor histidine kinase [Pseudonocardia autotrophica]GEC23654.1 two-component sensor histidine kinase [Pseudonocardia saturnea]
MTAGRAARRALHVLLGAVVLLPYAGLAWLLAGIVASGVGPVAVTLLVGPAVLVGAGVLVLPGVRELATAAARTLLDPAPGELPEPAPAPGAGGRVRAAGWLLFCVVCGTLGAATVLLVIPQSVGLLSAPWQPLPGLPTGADAWWTPVAGLALLPVAVVVPVLLGGLQARLAPRMLGPTPAERLAAELLRTRERADRQAGRARLARELHDSVGHALTVTTLQAGAAATVLDSDPAFVRRALESIAETGRAALDDLDHVLGVLRDDEGGGPASSAPVRDLDALDGLLAGARTAGMDLSAEVDSVAGIPATVSRELYRLAQEALTNALRHADPGPVELCLRRGPDGVELRVVNPAGGQGPGTRQGRGLAGAAERVALLGGTLSAAPHGGRWVLRASLPVQGGAR